MSPAASPGAGGAGAAGRAVGLCSIAALDRPLAEVAAAAAGAGADGLELTDRPPHVEAGASPGALREAGRRVRAAGLALLAWGSYLGHGGPRDPARVRREVAAAEALGAPLLRVWAAPDPELDATPGGPDEDAQLGELAGLLRRTCDAARPAGIDVVVERHVGSLADSARRVERLLDAVDRDNFALNYQALDFLPPEAAAEQPADARRLAPRARYFHLKNYRRDPAGGPLRHGASLRGGALDVAAILRAALDAGYAGPLAVEFLAADGRPLEARIADDIAFVREVLASAAGAGAGA